MQKKFKLWPYITEYSKNIVEGESIFSQGDGSVFVSLDISVTEELKEEGLLNEVLRGLQVARKESGCEVGQYISLKYSTESQSIKDLIEKYEESIKKSIFVKEIENLESLVSGIQIKVGDDVLMVEILKS